MTLFNTLLTALQGVSANKLRAILTTLGVVMGVASVIAMLALGNGARAAVDEAIEGGMTFAEASAAASQAAGGRRGGRRGRA